MLWYSAFSIQHLAFERIHHLFLFPRDQYRLLRYVLCLRFGPFGQLACYPKLADEASKYRTVSTFGEDGIYPSPPVVTVVSLTGNTTAAACCTKYRANHIHGWSSAETYFSQAEVGTSGHYCAAEKE